MSYTIEISNSNLASVFGPVTECEMYSVLGKESYTSHVRLWLRTFSGEEPKVLEFVQTKGERTWKLRRTFVLGEK